MQVQILNVSIETKPTKTGKTYQQAEVAYKNLTFQGKVESKKLMSFGAQAEAFKTMSTAAAGQVFNVTVVKNPAGYNDWTSAQSATEGSPDTSAPPASQGYAAKTGTTPVKSTYETPEERAQKQVYIIRQSNLNSAVALLGIGAKTTPKLAEVLDTAKAMEAYVFGQKAAVDEPSGFEGMDSDIPE